MSIKISNSETILTSYTQAYKFGGMKKDTLADRLNLAMEKLGMSQGALAKASGVAQPTIWRLTSGNAKGSTRIVDIANALGVRPEWLASGDGEMQEMDGIHHPDSTIPPQSEWGKVSAWDKNTPLDDDEVEVPFLKDIELACGDGSCLDSDYNGFKLRFSKSTLRRVGAQRENVICFPATGNSMEPTIPDGTTVAIDIGNKKIIDGKVYAINQDGWKRLKLLYRIGPNKVAIRSYNSDEYPDEEASLEDLEIMGRMFWSSTIW